MDKDLVTKDDFDQFFDEYYGKKVDEAGRVSWTTGNWDSRKFFKAWSKQEAALTINRKRERNRQTRIQQRRPGGID